MTTETEAVDIRQMGINPDLVAKYISKGCPFCGAKIRTYIANEHRYGQCLSPTCHDGKIGWRIE
jgi:hypothetical protein